MHRAPRVFLVSILKKLASGTVYRDRRGKKLDMLNEFMRNSAATEAKVLLFILLLKTTHLIFLINAGGENETSTIRVGSRHCTETAN